MAKRSAMVRGGDVSVTVRATRSATRGVEIVTSDAGATDGAEVAAVVSFAGAASSQVIVVQQSLCVETAIVASERCEQHGIRVQKPMIAASGAIPAISSTIARLSDLRVIVDIRFTETVDRSETFRRIEDDRTDRRKFRSPRHVSFITRRMPNAA
jgi:hypothetical protein